MTAKRTYSKKKNKENQEALPAGATKSTKSVSQKYNKLRNCSMNRSINRTMNLTVNQSLNNTNRLITDYFQVRKSTRKCKSDIERERREHVERAIKEQLEEGK